MHEPRSQGPQKRQRRIPDEEDIFPDQSASDIGVTELSERTRLSRPSHSTGSSPKRATSPVRDLLNDLRVSKPSVLCEIPSSVTLPERAASLQRNLMDHLEERLIPAGLKVTKPVSLNGPFKAANKRYSTASNTRNISLCSCEHPNCSLRPLRYAING